MADLKARRVLGGQFSADDTLELQFTYEGDAHSCIQHIEEISGPTVTHGGGAAAATPLHYKAWMRDDGSTDAVDGVIDYASSMMTMVQTEKGTSVVKAVANIILKADYDAWVTTHANWVSTYVTETTTDQNEILWKLEDGAPDEPAFPEPTEYKSGEITLVWQDDSFV
tara:strand:+ start:392 stop:895 length:504 start_codon:yes stop_codon:yes gene_type:complete